MSTSDPTLDPALDPAVEAHLEATREARLASYLDLLRIPSISTLAEHAGDMRRAAEWIAAELTRIGFDHAEVSATPWHPIVYADWLHAAGAPTVLVYCHYDVQPVDPIELWETARSSPSSATAGSSAAARPMTRASSTCTSAPRRRCSRRGAAFR